jgi:predicted PurR-regulated permease PerM
MDFILSESQSFVILQEEKNSKMTKSIQSLNDFTAKIFEKEKVIENLNWKFWRSWGAGIGGFMMPLKNFLETGEFNLESWQITMILTGIFFVYFDKNKNQLKIILDKIVDEGLIDVFKKTLSKSEELKESFIDFLLSLNVTLGTVVELMHYSFLLPIFEDIRELSEGSSDPLSTASMIAQRIIAAKGVSVSGTVLTEIISKMIERFRK